MFNPRNINQNISCCFCCRLKYFIKVSNGAKMSNSVYPDQIQSVLNPHKLPLYLHRSKYSLFIVALWPPAGKGLTSWLSCVLCFIVYLLLSYVVAWVKCGTCIDF